MAEPTRHGDLEIADDPEFQDRQWQAERIAWWAMGGLLLLALLGLFSEGPLSRLHWEHSGITVETQRYLRRGVDKDLTITSRIPAALQVAVPRAYWDELNVTAVEPPATARADTPDAVVLYLPPSPQGSVLRLRCKPQAFGMMQGSVVAGPVTFPMNHFVHP